MYIRSQGVYYLSSSALRLAIDSSSTKGLNFILALATAACNYIISKSRERKQSTLPFAEFARHNYIVRTVHDDRNSKMRQRLGNPMAA